MIEDPTDQFQFVVDDGGKKTLTDLRLTFSPRKNLGSFFVEEFFSQPRFKKSKGNMKPNTEVEERTGKLVERDERRN